MINKLTTSILSLCSALLLSTFVQAAPVEIAYQGTGTSIVTGRVYSGLLEVSIDGKKTFAMCDDYDTPMKTRGSWSANEHSYADIQNGYGKFNVGRHGATKYNMAGWLFSQMDMSKELSTFAAKKNAAINHVIWSVMRGSSTLRGVSRDIKSLATGFYIASLGHKDYDWSGEMRVFTAVNKGESQELLVSAVPIPGALFLFGSALLGFFGLTRRSRT